MKNTLILIVSTLCILANWSVAQKPLDMKLIDEIFAEWDKENVPGGSVGILKDGKLVYGKGYGQANLDYGIANSSKSVFRIASTSKQFTAACIVLLSQEGKLNLDDPLSKYYPKFPSYADTITIRHLLHHTSGLRDYLTVAGLKGLRHNDYYTDAEIETWLARQKSINFSPGDEMVYSNSGYWILGQIVEKASGINMRGYAEEKIFKPLGMKQTHFHNNHAEIVPQRSTGYYPSLGGFEESRTNLNMIGDGGIFTSIEDMLKWDQAFYDKKVLNEDFWKIMTTTGKLNNGKEIDYAAGLFVSDYKGIKMISHGGSFVGYRAEYIRFPEHNLGIAVFCNRADADPTRYAMNIADLYLSDQFVEKKAAKKDMAKSKPTSKSAPLIPQKMLEGEYQIRPGLIMNITDKKDSLLVTQYWDGHAYGLLQKTGNTYQVSNGDDLLFEFHNVKDNLAQECKIYQGSREFTMKRKINFDTSSVDMDKYTGRYYSEELDANYHIAKADEGITLQIENGSKMPLTFEDAHTLSCSTGTLALMAKGENIVGFKLNAGRAKNIKFLKQ